MQSGVSLADIQNVQWCRINTKFAESVLEGLRKSGVVYSAKYDDEALSLAYSSADSDIVQEILGKINSDQSEVIERIRSHGNIQDEYSVLIPEIADILGVSAATVESRPAEMTNILLQTYVNCWYCDNQTIREELHRITSLSAEDKLEDVKVISNERERSLFSRNKLQLEAMRINQEKNNTQQNDVDVNNERKF